MTVGKSASELEGSVKQFSLPDIVQFLGAADKTGRLFMKAGDASTEGSIFFSSGSVVHAEVDGATGEEAFFELLRWTDGTFTFEPDVAFDEKTVRQSSTNLLLEGARRNDEWDVLKKHIPDIDAVPEFVLPSDDEAGQQITLNTSEWVVLSKIDGERTVKEVADAAGISEYHTCRLIYPLIANKLIKLRNKSGH